VNLGSGNTGRCELMMMMMIIIIIIIIIINVIQKEAEKKLKYKNLSIEMQRMWNMKCFVIPVIIGATGIVRKSLQKYLETIPGQHSINSLQKNCHTGNITHHRESATS
jgi:uncharacterized oligopeptide transporter (OPT) family protein